MALRHRSRYFDHLSRAWLRYNAVQGGRLAAAGGIVDGANSKGITSLNVGHPTTGVYCVNIPSFVPRGGQVATQGGGAPTIAQVNIGGGASCPPSAVQLLTWSTGATPAPVDTGFLVALYR